MNTETKTNIITSIENLDLQNEVIKKTPNQFIKIHAEQGMSIYRLYVDKDKPSCEKVLELTENTHLEYINAAILNDPKMESMVNIYFIDDMENILEEIYTDIFRITDERDLINFISNTDKSLFEYFKEICLVTTEDDMNDMCYNSYKVKYLHGYKHDIKLMSGYFTGDEYLFITSKDKSKTISCFTDETRIRTKNDELVKIKYDISSGSVNEIEANNLKLIALKINEE